MQKWSAINEEDIHLATIRVYDRDRHTNAKQRIVLILPPDPSNPSSDLTASSSLPSTSLEPEEYELDMVNDVVENQVVIAERETEPDSRARTTILTGRIKHDCNIRPSFTESYRRRMRERNRIANTPKRQIRLIDDVMQGRGAVNMLSSGIGDMPSGTAFPSLAVSIFLDVATQYHSQLISQLSCSDQKPRKGRSSASRVYRATSFWICSLRCIANDHDGLLRSYAHGRSSPKRT